ncbi:ubiquinol-cytochrome C reductase complex 7.8 kDa family protein [Tripterygium wilfordii]|uniref:Complex III subunit VI n=1 Tax=Tripterygium wilfordii TaxID=458696 RepID=A0A7J7CCQ7_TRIWF|nr:ubiquinol-cytochrome C reductase complex 7.8 kDa family protein [Tripterygium wilfordii]
MGEQIISTSIIIKALFPSSFGADEEPVDPKKYLEEACKPKCVKPLLEYQACIKRIRGDESGTKHCTGQYFDYWSCVDKCGACWRYKLSSRSRSNKSLAFVYDIEE